MTIATSFSIGLSLSVDAFAAAFVQGTASDAASRMRAVLVAACFAIFAAGFLLLGWALSTAVGTLFQAFDHWVAFFLLAGVGLKMMRDSRAEASTVRLQGVGRILLMAATTSLDAAAVGMTLIVLGLPLLQTAVLTALCSFACTLVGFSLGRLTSSRLPRRAEWLGGAVLIVIGSKILLSHTLLI